MSVVAHDEYAGPAVISHGDVGIAVQVSLSGRFEPVDGRYHWGGRVWPDEEIRGLLRAGNRSVGLRVPGGTGVTGRLAEVDPWGGVRVVGTSVPPWAVPGLSTVERP